MWVSRLNSLLFSIVCLRVNTLSIQDLPVLNPFCSSSNIASDIVFYWLIIILASMCALGFQVALYPSEWRTEILLLYLICPVCATYPVFLIRCDLGEKCKLQSVVLCNVCLKFDFRSDYYKNKLPAVDRCEILVYSNFATDREKTATYLLVNVRGRSPFSFVCRAETAWFLSFFSQRLVQLT